MPIFAQLRREAAQRGLKFLVIAAHAVMRHGYLRATEDADILANKAEHSQWEELVRHLGYSVLHDGGTFLQLPPTGGLSFHAQPRIFVATAPCDLRAGFNVLWSAAHERLGEVSKAACFLSSAAGGWTKQHSTYRFGPVVISYAWHPMHGQNVSVVRRRGRRGTEWNRSLRVWGWHGQRFQAGHRRARQSRLGMDDGKTDAYIPRRLWDKNTAPNHTTTRPPRQTPRRPTRARSAS